MLRVANVIHTLGGYPREGTWAHLTSGMWVHIFNSIPHYIIIIECLFNILNLRILIFTIENTV